MIAFKPALVVMGVLAAVGSARAQTTGSAEEGQSLARSLCAQCHLVDKRAGRSPNAAAPTFARIANTPGMTSTALTAALRTSHRTMPNVIVKDSDLNDLVAYILGLKDH